MGTLRKRRGHITQRCIVAGSGAQTRQPVPGDRGGNIIGSVGDGLKGTFCVVIHVLGGQIGIPQPQRQRIGVRRAGGGGGFDAVAGLTVHLYIQPLLVIQCHGDGSLLLHLHRIGDALAVGRQHHGNQVFLAGILLAVRQVHRHGGTTLGGLPGHGDGSAAAQSRGGDLHLILRRDHVVGIGGPIIGRTQGQAGHRVRSRQITEAGSADQVERVGLILLIGTALQTGLAHHVRIFQAVGLDTIRQGSCLALPAAGLVAVGVARFVDTDVGLVDTITGLKIGIERVVRMVRDQVGTLGGGNVQLGHLAVDFPEIVDTNAYGLDPLAGRQLGGEGGTLLHLQRATDMAELAVGQVEGVGGGDQVHGVGVLHRDNGAELTGEHRLAGGDGLAAHGGADGQRRGLALQELGVLVDGAEQRIVQGLGRGVRGGIEALHGGIIGLLSGLVILQAVGSGVIDRHVGRQLLEVCSMALVRVGGEPDCRQAIR